MKVDHLCETKKRNPCLALILSLIGHLKGVSRGLEGVGLVEGSQIVLQIGGKEKEEGEDDVSLSMFQKQTCVAVGCTLRTCFSCVTCESTIPPFFQICTFI